MNHAPDKLRVPEGVILGEPTWDIARLFPTQGNWSEAEYLALDTNRLVEFSHGVVEFLATPTFLHQQILKFLFKALEAFVEARKLGEVFFMGVRVRLEPGIYREPDVLFMSAEHAGRINNEYWDGADLVMEVVSADEKDRRRDLKSKREEYARARIPEYWIVDPQLETMTVLTLDGQSYVVHGEFKRGERATSKLLPGFAVDVDQALMPRRVNG